jgi:hypothetical protein
MLVLNELLNERLKLEFTCVSVPGFWIMLSAGYIIVSSFGEARLAKGGFGMNNLVWD